ncbi:hypothetical protein HK103_001352 [Boothiomyces macroporosus]|uniref:Ankyrin repeat protein n=1 Tax=Boothiomyces macroporosus TaxID=261099 RepID=A0AAD5Y0M9_9FUNG|nr:hypothetical protein HK103_001352 [Boothiomyces macroporosus]
MLEILQSELVEISTFLTLEEYYQLKFSIKTINFKPKLNPTYFNESIKSNIDYEPYMNINKDLIDSWDTFAVFLVQKEQYSYFRLIKPETLQQSTKLYVSHYKIGDEYGLKMLLNIPALPSILISKAMHGYTQSARYLIKRMDPSSYDNGAIIAAAENNNLEILELLLNDDRVDPIARSNEPIRQAAQKGHYRIVERLMKLKRVNPADKHNEALVNACYFGHLDIVELLLRDKRVNPAANNNEPIRLAALNGHYEIVRYLLEFKRVDPNARDNQAYYLAEIGRHYRVLELLEPYF